MERLLEEMLPSPGMAVVVADILPWAVRRGTMTCSFYPISATHFTAFYHFKRLPAAHRMTSSTGDSLAVTGQTHLSRSARLLLLFWQT